MKLPLWRIAEFVGSKGECDQEAVAMGYSIDSRTLNPGDLFIAIAGERFDGHNYVQAALVNGEGDLRIMTRQIVPNVASPVIVQTTVAIPVSIVGAAILSFLGLGVQPPTADWGAMLAQAQGYLNQSAWLGIFPGIAIFIAALSFNLLGDGVTDALNPRRAR